MAVVGKSCYLSATTVKRRSCHQSCPVHVAATEGCAAIDRVEDECHHSGNGRRYSQERELPCEWKLNTERNRNAIRTENSSCRRRPVSILNSRDIQMGPGLRRGDGGGELSRCYRLWKAAGSRRDSSERSKKIRWMSAEFILSKSKGRYDKLSSWQGNASADPKGEWR